MSCKESEKIIVYKDKVYTQTEFKTLLSNGMLEELISHLPDKITKELAVKSSISQVEAGVKESLRTVDSKNEIKNYDKEGNLISVTPKNAKGYHDALQDIGGLTKEQASANTVLFDKFAQREAERTGKSKDEIYQRYEITKGGVTEKGTTLSQSLTRDEKLAIGYRYDTDKTARERFNIPKLKKIGGGSDRDVFELGDGKVVKIAKTARGLEQNRMEGEEMLSGIVPRVFERGLNYVVVEDIPRAKPKDKIFTYDWDGNVTGESTISEMQKELSKFTQRDFNQSNGELQDVLAKYGLTDIMNFNVLWGDFIAMRNWGYKDGKAYHTDAGTFAGEDLITSYRGKSNLDDADFRNIYYESKRLKKQFQDTDKSTMYQKEKGFVFFKNSPDGRAIEKVVVGLTNPDASTPVHELISHPYFEARLLEAKLGNNESRQIVSDILSVYNEKTGKKLKIEDLTGDNYVSVQEFWASQVEKGIQNGFKLKNSKLQAVFDKMMRWFREIFGIAEKIDPKIEKTIKDMFGEEAFDKIIQDVKKDKSELQGRAKISEGVDILANILGAKKNFVEEERKSVYDAIRLIAEGIVEEFQLQGEALFNKLKEILKERGFIIADKDISEAISDMPQVPRRERWEKQKTLLRVFESNHEDEIKRGIQEEGLYYRPKNFKEGEKSAILYTKTYMDAGLDDVLLSHLRNKSMEDPMKLWIAGAMIAEYNRRGRERELTQEELRNKEDAIRLLGEIGNRLGTGLKAMQSDVIKEATENLTPEDLLTADIQTKTVNNAKDEILKKHGVSESVIKQAIDEFKESIEFQTIVEEMASQLVPEYVKEKGRNISNKLREKLNQIKNENRLYQLSIPNDVLAVGLERAIGMFEKGLKMDSIIDEAIKSMSGWINENSIKESEVRSAFVEELKGIVGEKEFNEYQSATQKVKKFDAPIKDATEVINNITVNSRWMQRSRAFMSINSTVMNKFIKDLTDGIKEGGTIREAFNKALDGVRKSEFYKNHPDKDKLEETFERITKALILSQKDIEKKWRKTLDRLPEEKRAKVAQQATVEFIDRGFLSDDNFALTYAEAIGIKTFTEEIRQAINNLKAKTDVLNNTVREIQRNPTLKNYRKFKDAVFEQKKAIREVNRLYPRNKEFSDAKTFIALAQGKALVPSSIIINSISLLPTLPLRTASEIVNTLIEGSIYLVDRYVRGNKDAYLRYNVLTRLKYGLKTMDKDIREVIYEMFNGLLPDQSQTDYKGLDPQYAHRDFIHGLKNLGSRNLDKMVNDFMEAYLSPLAEVVFRSLNLSDKPLREMFYRSELASIGEAKGLKGDDLLKFIVNPTREDKETAQSKAKQTIYQGTVFGMKKNIRNIIIDKWGKFINTVIPTDKLYSRRLNKFFKFMGNSFVGMNMLFVDTPMNIMMRAAKLSMPEVMFLSAISHMKGMKSLGIKKDIPLAYQQLSTALIGFALREIAIQMILSGLITPAYDDDDEKKLRAFSLAIGAKRSGNINLSAVGRMITFQKDWNVERDDDKWIPYMYFGELGLVLGAHATVYANYKDKDEAKRSQNPIYIFSNAKWMYKTVTPLVTQWFNTTYLSTTNLLVQTIRGDDISKNKYIPKLVRTYTLPFYSNTMGKLSMGMDAYQRETRDADAITYTWNLIQEATFQGEKLPAKIDITGKKVLKIPYETRKEENKLSDKAKRSFRLLFDPFKGNKIDIDDYTYKLFGEFYDNYINYDKKEGLLLLPPPVDDYLIIAGKKVKLPSDLTEERREYIYSERDRLSRPYVLSHEFDNDDLSEKIKKLKNMYSTGREMGEVKFLRNNAEKIEKLWMEQYKEGSKSKIFEEDGIPDINKEIIKRIQRMSSEDTGNGWDIPSLGGVPSIGSDIPTMSGEIPKR